MDGFGRIALDVRLELIVAGGGDDVTVRRSIGTQVDHVDGHRDIAARLVGAVLGFHRDDRRTLVNRKKNPVVDAYDIGVG